MKPKVFPMPKMIPKDKQNATGLVTRVQHNNPRLIKAPLRNDKTRIPSLLIKTPVNGANASMTIGREKAKPNIEYEVLNDWK